jgi:hypothetical protein
MAMEMEMDGRMESTRRLLSPLSLSVCSISGSIAPTRQMGDVPPTCNWRQQQP